MQCVIWGIFFPKCTYPRFEGFFLVHSLSMQCLIWGYYSPNAHIQCLHAIIWGSLSMQCLFILMLLHRSFLTNVILHCKVPKTEQDLPDVPPGFEPLVPKPGVIPYNSRLLKPVLPGREAEATELTRMTKGKRPRIGHMPRPLLPRRFYTQLDLGDLQMLVIPRSFHAALKAWLAIPLPRCIPIGACKFCDKHVQLSYYKDIDEIVLGRHWPEVVNRYDMQQDDIVVFKLTATGFNIDIYKSLACGWPLRLPFGLQVSYFA